MPGDFAEVNTNTIIVAVAYLSISACMLLHTTFTHHEIENKDKFRMALYNQELTAGADGLPRTSGHSHAIV